MTLVNLTPHAVTLVVGDHQVVFQPSGDVARVSQINHLMGTIEVEGLQVPVGAPQFGELTGLPDPQDGIMFFVSRLVLQAARAQGRTDCVCPLDTVRDEAGRIVGLTALATE